MLRDRSTFFPEYRCEMGRIRRKERLKNDGTSCVIARIGCLISSTSIIPRFRSDASSQWPSCLPLACDAPGHRGCVTNVISWGRNHRWPGIMSSSWSNVVYFPYSPCRVIKLIHLSQPLRSALPPITTTEIPNISCFPSRKKRKIFPSFSSGTEIFRKKFATNETRIQNSPRRWLRIPRACWSTRAIEGGREQGQEFR